MDSSSNSEWASLPAEILHSILDYLVPMRDYFGFSEVCGHWKYAVREKLKELRSNRRRHCRLHQKLPLLVVPNFTAFNSDRYCLYDVVRGKPVREFQLRRGSWRFEGSSHGWLILFHLGNHHVTLFNPVSGKFIHLPSIDKSINGMSPCMKRCILSADPALLLNKRGKDCIKFVLMMWASDSNREVAFLTSGDKAWTNLNKLRYLEDITCIDGIFYMVDSRNVVFSCEVSSNNEFKLRCIPSAVDRCSLDRYLAETSSDRCRRNEYLVESPDGDLWRVEKNITGFLVYRFVWFSRNSRWEEVKNLGDVALFLGYNSSISLVATDFPGCKRNCIYYCGAESNKIPYVDAEVIVFSLDDGTLTPLCPNIRRPALWISPNLK